MRGASPHAAPRLGSHPLHEDNDLTACPLPEAEHTRFRMPHSLDIPPYSDAAAGFLLGFFILHPLAMYLAAESAGLDGVAVMWRELPLVLFSVMGVYFGVLGALSGAAGGYFRRKALRRSRALAEAIRKQGVTLLEKESLLRILAHDLANSVLAASAGAQLLERKAAKLSPEQAPSDEHVEELRELAQDTRATLRSAFELIDSTKKMLAIQAGHMAMEFVPTDLAALTHDAVKLFVERARDKSVEIDVRAPDTPAANAPTEDAAGADETDAQDEALIAMVEPVIFKNTVLGNILSNAVKFSKPGEVIRVTAHRVRLENTPLQGRIEAASAVVIAVSNIGPCVPHARQPRLVGAAGEASCISRRGSAGERGAGFGLSLATRFITVMDGLIEVESVPVRRPPLASPAADCDAEAAPSSDCDADCPTDCAEVCRTTFRMYAPVS